MRNRRDEETLLLSLGAGAAQFSLIERALEMGMDVIAVDRNPNSTAFDLHCEPLVASTHESGPILEKLSRKLGKRKLGGVLNRSSGPPVVTAAEVAAAYNIPSLPRSSAEECIHKTRLRVACQKAGIPVPAFHIISSSDGGAVEEWKFPVVVKPSLSMLGKSGISMVTDSDQLDVAIGRAIDTSLDGQVLVEEYLPGADLSLVSFVESGNLHTICLLDEINGFDSLGRVVGKGFAGPSIFTDSATALEIEAIARQIIDYFQVQRSPLMVSFRLDGKGHPRLIEIHLDLGGDLLIEALFPRILEMDFLEVAVSHARGDLQVPQHPVKAAAAILYEAGEGLVSERTFRILDAATPRELREAIQSHV